MFLLCHPLDFRYYYLDKLVRTKYFLQQFYISPKDTDWARCFAFCCCYCCFCYFYYHWYHCCWCYCYWGQGLEHSLLLTQLPVSAQLLLLDTSHWGRKVSKTPRVGGRHQRIYYCDILSHIPYTLGLFPYLISFIPYSLSLISHALSQILYPLSLDHVSHFPCPMSQVPCPRSIIHYP